MFFNNSHGCPFCGADVVFDLGLDIHVCYNCGAHETAKGWMNPPHEKQPSPKKNAKPDDKPEEK